MTRIEITLGLLTTIAAILVMAMIGANEEERMAGAARGFTVRSVERGAKLFDGQCALCHGPNASGGKCPPLNQNSGLHGGNLGTGVAWRLEELGWERTMVFEYVVNVISNGRNESTRPWQWKGNRGVGGGTDAVMAMPAFAQANNGPLRPDQIRDIANYIVAFNDFMPTDVDEAKSFVAAVPNKVSIFDDPAAKQRPDGSDPVALGDYLFNQELGCATCHAVDAASALAVGPNLSAVWTNADQRLADPAYTGAAADAASYITESIRNPTAYVVSGFAAGVMPATFGSLPDADIGALIAYLSKGAYTPLGASGAITATTGITATDGTTATIGLTATGGTTATTAP